MQHVVLEDTVQRQRYDARHPLRHEVPLKRVEGGEGRGEPLRTPLLTCQ
jgi:hypothetical protein